MVDGGAVPRDQAARLQPLDPLVHRRGGQPRGLAEVGEGHPPVLGQQPRGSGGRSTPAPVCSRASRVAARTWQDARVTSPQNGEPAGRAPDAARHRQPVLPGVLRRARLGAGARRHAGQRRARADGLHQPAGHRVPPHRAGLLLGQRLATAVARRPDPDLQGAPRRRGGRLRRPTSRRCRTRSRPRSRSSSRCSRRSASAWSAPTSTRRTTSSAPWPPGPASRSTSSPATATSSSSSTTRPRSGCSTSPAASAGTSGSPTTGCARSTTSTPPSTPPSPPCAATPPTACPGSPGSARRPPPPCSTGSATWTGSSRPPPTPTPTSAPRPRRRIKEAADYLEVAPTVVAVVRDLDLGEYDATLPRTPAHPDRVVELDQRWGLGGSAVRLVEALACSRPAHSAGVAAHLRRDSAAV